MRTEQTHRERVFREMQKDILDGVLKPGEPISEREYSRRANVSRVPVREALIQLEGRGLVTHLRDRGAFVRAIAIDELRELYEVRETLEGTAARSAAGRMDPGILSEFEAKMLSFRSADSQEERDEIRKTNTEFHLAIARSCNNDLLHRMLSDIRGQIELSRAWRFANSSSGEILERVNEHISILWAILAGDGALAEREMRTHIANWRRLNL